MVFRPPKTWSNSGVKDTDLNRQVRDQIRSLQKQIILLQSSSSAGTVRTGTIIPTTSATVPAGYLLCDGRSDVLKDSYPDLWLTVGVAYGAATTNTFTLPDFRSKFLRGNSAVGDGTITGRGSLSGSDSSSVTQTLTVNNTIAANAVGNHFHRLGFSHTHNGTAQHHFASSTVAHSHNNTNHYHGFTGGSTANGNRGAGNQLRAAASHSHDTNTQGLGGTSGNNDAYNVQYNESVNTVSAATALSDTTGSGAHSHNVQHDMIFDHSHTADTLPAYLSMAFVIKT
jgi:microcystin-dependent protein